MALYRAQLVYDRPDHAGEDVMTNTISVRSSEADQVVASAAQLVNYLTTWWTTGVGASQPLKNFVSLSARLIDVRVYPGFEGGQPLAQLQGTGYTPVAGASAGNTHPPQVALGITFRTALRRRWGRIYLPYPSTAMGSVRPQTGVCNDLAQSTGAMAGDLETAVPGGTLVVAGNPAAGGQTHVVNVVAVDNVFDVIRLRRFEKTTHRAAVTITQGQNP